MQTPLLEASGPIEASAPGKIILLGEHAVVYGYPALAGTIDRRIIARGRLSNIARLTTPKGISGASLAALRRAFAIALEATHSPPLTMTLHSSLPVGVGLGSSGAMSVAVARLLWKAAGNPAPTSAKVEAVAMAMECVFHGTPSGLDHTTCARGGLLLFQRNLVRRVSTLEPLWLVVALAGTREPTHEVVSALRKRRGNWPRRYERIIREIAALVREGAQAVRNGELRTLGDLMNMNQGLLAALGVSSAPIENAVFRLRDAGAIGAKLTGAGGAGGAVVGLFATREEATKANRRIRGFVTEVGSIA